MHIESIMIESYRSIKSLQKIDMSNNFMTIIGKNGSGKTSLLRAINTLFNANPYATYHEEKNASFGVDIRLSQKDYNEFFRDFDIQSNCKSLHVGWKSGSIEGLVLKSDLIAMSSQNIKSQLEELLGELTKDYDIYTNMLYEIEYEKKISPDFKAYDFVNEENSVTASYLFTVEVVKRNGKNILNNIREFIKEHFVGDEYIITRDSYIPRVGISGDLEFVGIQYRQLNLSPLLRKCVNIDEHKYQELISNAQTTLSDTFRRIKFNLERFNAIVDGFRNLVARESEIITNRSNQKEKRAKSLIDSLVKTVRRNCYFLDNESGIMFGSSEHRFRERQNPVYMVIDNLLRSNGYLKQGENQSVLSKFSSNDKEVVENLVDGFLASVVASFDRDKIQALKSSIGEKGIELGIVELDGTFLDINETSLGRRWYLSYEFIKHLLHPGDVFIIDEPASFLHPEAQQQILSDLEILSKKNPVIISTHSPYMLSALSAYYETKVTDHGVEITYIDKNDLLKIRDIIGLTEYTNILFDSKAKHILVEGNRDVACIQRFMKMFEIDVRKFNIFPCDGFSMATVSRFLEKHGREFLAFIDFDHYYDDNLEMLKKKYGRNSEYLKLLISSKYYVDFIRRAKNEPNRYVFVGEKDGTGEMEDLFFGEDKASVTNEQGKVISQKVVDKKVFNNTTICNFRELFKKAGLIS